MYFDPERLPKLPSRMHETEFVEVFGGIYEHSPWVARGAWHRGLDGSGDTVEDVAAALAAVVDEADHETRIALIRAHPDLAGRAAVDGGLSPESSREQAGAGIDRCTPDEYERFHALNDAYKEKFAFPFVMAVKGSDRHRILAAFEERIGNDQDAEFQRAIAEIHKIARLRLNELGETGS